MDTNEDTMADGDEITNTITKKQINDLIKTGKVLTEEEWKAIFSSYIHQDDLEKINIIKASLSEAKSGEVDDRYMTPSTTKEVLIDKTASVDDAKAGTLKDKFMTPHLVQQFHDNYHGNRNQVTITPNATDTTVEVDFSDNKNIKLDLSGSTVNKTVTFKGLRDGEGGLLEVITSRYTKIDEYYFNYNTYLKVTNYNGIYKSQEIEFLKELKKELIKKENKFEGGSNFLSTPNGSWATIISLPNKTGIYIVYTTIGSLISYDYNQAIIVYVSKGSWGEAYKFTQVANSNGSFIRLSGNNIQVAQGNGTGANWGVEYKKII